MSDVGDILGLQAKQIGSSANDILRSQGLGGSATASTGKSIHTAYPKLSQKPKGMSREVFGLVGADGLAPAMESNKISQSFKAKRNNALKGKWVWAPFQSSARADSLVLNHWVKADIQYADYPYAKFNISSDKIMYTDEEYTKVLQSNYWSKAETDHLMSLANKFDLRWPIIVDKYNMKPLRSVEDLQYRYYLLVKALKEFRLAHMSNDQDAGGGSSNINVSHVFEKGKEPFTCFNMEEEMYRRYQLEMSYRRSKEEEVEEQKLREELKSIDAFLKKAKKTGVKPQVSAHEPVDADANIASMSSSHAPASKAPAAKPSASAPSNAINVAQNKEKQLSAAIVYPPQTVPDNPKPGNPILQSQRLIVCEPSLNISKTLVKKLNALLRDFGAPEYPVPTKAVADLYDSVRKDALSLLSLNSVIAEREKELALIRNQQVGTLAGVQSISRDVHIPLYTSLAPFPKAPEPKPKINSDVGISSDESSAVKSSGETLPVVASEEETNKNNSKGDISNDVIKTEIENSAIAESVDAEGAANFEAIKSERALSDAPSMESIPIDVSTAGGEGTSADALATLENSIPPMPKVVLPSTLYAPQLNFDNAVPFLVEPFYSTSLVDPITTAILGMSSNVNSMAFGSSLVEMSGGAAHASIDASTTTGSAPSRKGSVKRKNTATEDNLMGSPAPAGGAEEKEKSPKQPQKRTKAAKPPVTNNNNSISVSNTENSADILDSSFDADALFLNTDSI